MNLELSLSRRTKKRPLCHRTQKQLRETKERKFASFCPFTFFFSCRNGKMQKHSFMVPSHYKPLAVTLLRSSALRWFLSEQRTEQRGWRNALTLFITATLLTGDAAFQHCWSIVFRVLLELNGMASLSSSSDEGHERVPFSPDSTRRRANNRVIKRVFVHLHNRPRNCSPQGGEWDSLEREARVKTLAFDRSQSGQSMVTMLTSNFPSVAGEDFGQ